MEFTTADGRAPTLRSPVAAKELVAFAAMGLGSSAILTSTVTPLKLSLEGGNAVDLPADGYRFQNLSAGSHDIALSDGKQEKEFVLDAGDHPSINIALYSDRNVGSVLVHAGVDAFSVFLNGTRFERRVRNGEMFISGLPARKYKMRILADGYEPVDEREVEVSKGGVARQEFNLTAVPQFASLLLRGLPPHSQVLIDGTRMNATEQQGALKIEKAPLGEHTIEVRNSHYRFKSTTRLFTKNETAVLTASDLGMEKMPASIPITTTPGGAQLVLTCGEGAAQYAVAPMTAHCGDAAVHGSRPSRWVRRRGGEDHRTDARRVPPCIATPVAQGRGC